MLSYSLLHKTSPKTCLLWASVRFYETGVMRVTHMGPSTSPLFLPPPQPPPLPPIVYFSLMKLYITKPDVKTNINTI